MDTLGTDHPDEDDDGEIETDCLTCCDPGGQLDPETGKCPRCYGPCERCGQVADLDPDCGLCARCEDHNTGRVAL